MTCPSFQTGLKFDDINCGEPAFWPNCGNAIIMDTSGPQKAQGILANMRQGAGIGIGIGLAIMALIAIVALGEGEGLIAWIGLLLAAIGNFCLWTVIEHPGNALLDLADTSINQSKPEIQICQTLIGHQVEVLNTEVFGINQSVNNKSDSN